MKGGMVKGGMVRGGMVRGGGRGTEFEITRYDSVDTKCVHK